MTRKDIVNFLKSDKTYSKVMDILSEKAERPIPTANNNFIAGGCVANVLYSMIHGGVPIIRDIDIFKFDKVTNNQGDIYPEWVEPTNPDFPRPMETELMNTNDSYGNRVVRSNGDFSIMISSSRDGIFNTVKVHVGSRKEKPNQPLILLQSFDLNACQAGVTDKEIIYTEDFVDFLRGKQLLVTVPINPIQTTMRLRRKLSDLSCYCDMEHEVNMLKHTCLLGETSKTFGEETYKKYLAEQDTLDKDFIISEYIDRGTKDMWSFEGEKKPSKKDKIKLWLFEPILSEYELPYGFMHPLEMLNYFRIMGKTTSHSKKKKFQKVIDGIYSNGVEKSRNKAQVPTVLEMPLSIPYDYTKSGSDNIKSLKKQKIHHISHPMWGLLSMVPNYSNCDFDVKHIEYITKFSREHSNLSRLFNDVKNFTIQKHYNLIKLLKSISTKRGDWIIGELENLSKVNIDGLISSDDIPKWIEEYMDSVEVELSKELTTPFDLSGFEYNGCVTEITNALTLRSEGIRMGHCVGGYGGQIENGSCKIFHIECDGIGSTIQISSSSPNYSKTNGEYNVNTNRQYGDKFTNELTSDEKHLLTVVNSKIKNCGYRNSQHYGKYPEKGNLTPTDDNKDVAERLVVFLNENHNEEKLTKLLLERHRLEQQYVKLAVKRYDERNRHKEPIVSDMWL